jgi:uncharacterized protein (DUF2141 family)
MLHLPHCLLNSILLVHMGLNVVVGESGVDERGTTTTTTTTVVGINLKTTPIAIRVLSTAKNNNNKKKKKQQQQCSRTSEEEKGENQQGSNSICYPWVCAARSSDINEHCCSSVG